MKKKVFILAGYSGVGKTTLTCYCLKHRIPLFGAENLDSFLNFRIPAQFPEWKMDVRTIAANNHWFSTSHLPSLHRMSPRPDCALIHIDLLGLITKNYLPSQSSEGKEMRYPRSIQSLRSHEDNMDVLSHVLRNDFLAGCDELVINTLYAPYVQICRQWHTKAWKAVASEAFFDLDKPEEAIHQAAYRGWSTFIETFKSTTLLSSEIVNGSLRIERVQERQG